MTKSDLYYEKLDSFDFGYTEIDNEFEMEEEETLGDFIARYPVHFVG